MGRVVHIRAVVTGSIAGPRAARGGVNTCIHRLATYLALLDVWEL